MSIPQKFSTYVRDLGAFQSPDRSREMMNYFTNFTDQFPELLKFPKYCEFKKIAGLGGRRGLVVRAATKRMDYAED